VLFDVSSDFAEGSQNVNDPLLCYSFWEKSLVTTLNIRCIPFSLKDEKKDSCFDLSEIGYQNFYPWFVANRNPSGCDDYLNVVLDFLPSVEEILKKKEYWFFRGDVNILMMWYRVSFAWCFILPF
jgi:hypothetical protein